MIAYHASHEQFAPGELVRLAILAEQNGFNAVHSSDHFHPWSERQGQSGFSFAWMGAAMQATTIPFGMICAPGQRYHPAIVAQASATLAEMFPDRYWLELGSGEAINECITGDPWPSKTERNERLEECAMIIRKLWAGETVTHSGSVTVKNAKLYTRPAKVPLMIGAALSPETAEWMGSRVDGLVTVNADKEHLQKMASAFRKGGGEGKPLYLKIQLSYALSEDEAILGAYDQWRNNIFPASTINDLRTVAEFDKLGEQVISDDLHRSVHISSDLNKHVVWLNEYIDMGFEHLILHNVNRQQEKFITDFGRHVIPEISKR
jgi:probable non-F420 flavinoid oxidoreductase